MIVITIENFDLSNVNKGQLQRLFKGHEAKYYFEDNAPFRGNVAYVELPPMTDLGALDALVEELSDDPDFEVGVLYIQNRPMLPL